MSMKYNSSFSTIHRELLYRYSVKLEIKDICFNFSWVKAHVGIYRNGKVDKLAKFALMNQVDQPLCVTSDIT
ncbi:hypothetical protein WA026_017235, partial [Henosepilachna vigintioctopunctata]